LLIGSSTCALRLVWEEDGRDNLLSSLTFLNKFDAHSALHSLSRALPQKINPSTLPPVFHQRTTTRALSSAPQPPDEKLQRGVELGMSYVWYIW
jgi:hypothetical protein